MKRTQVGLKRLVMSHVLPEISRHKYEEWKHDSVNKPGREWKWTHSIGVHCYHRSATQSRPTLVSESVFPVEFKSAVVNGFMSWHFFVLVSNCTNRIISPSCLSLHLLPHSGGKLALSATAIMCRVKKLRIITPQSLRLSNRFLFASM